jgi:hypothetical protein
MFADIKAEMRARAAAFPRLVLVDTRLPITARVAWLMVALSHKNGFASMKAERMATVLNSTPEAVEKARRKLVKLGLFARDGWKYHRVLLPGEDRGAYWQRVRGDCRLDSATRCAWLLCDLTRQGETSLSLVRLAALLGLPKKTATRALNKVAALGHFAKTPGCGRGHPNTYRRNEGLNSVALTAFFTRESTYASQVPARQPNDDADREDLDDGMVTINTGINALAVLLRQ